MKLKFISLFAVLLVGAFALSSCNIGIAQKDYSKTVTDISLFEFVSDASGETYGLKVREGADLPETVRLPETYEGKPVVSVLSEGFMNCSSLKEITLPASFTSIGSAAFNGCTSLSTVRSEKVSLVSANAFFGCVSLRYFDFDSVKEIGDYAFSETAVYELKFKAVEKIGVRAFYKCDKLHNVYIPETTVYIGEDAFSKTGNVLFDVSSSNPVYQKDANGKIVEK